MSRPKGNPGRRVNIYLDPKSDKIAGQIDNLSEFVQIALGQASAILAFDIIRRKKELGEMKLPTEEQMAEWNKNHPLDPLTQRRKDKKWQATQNSPQNPALS